MSTRRVLITEFVEGRNFAAVQRLDEEQRDRFAEICFRFFYGLLRRERIAAGDPHPGNYLLCPDGRTPRSAGGRPDAGVPQAPRPGAGAPGPVRDG